MANFKLGDWLIDTKINSAVNVISIIPAGANSITDLYVVESSDGDYYIIDESRIVAYDSSYWDNLE